MEMMVSNIALGKIHCSVEEEKLELKKVLQLKSINLK